MNTKLELNRIRSLGFYQTLKTDIVGTSNVMQQTKPLAMEPACVQVSKAPLTMKLFAYASGKASEDGSSPWAPKPSQEAGKKRLAPYFVSAQFCHCSYLGMNQWLEDIILSVTLLFN